MLKIFEPEDGKPIGHLTRIVVTDDCKTRYSGGPLHSNRDYFRDPWILYRSDVSSLSDAEWFATPSGWREVTEHAR